VRSVFNEISHPGSSGRTHGRDARGKRRKDWSVSGKCRGKSMNDVNVVSCVLE